MINLDYYVQMMIEYKQNISTLDFVEFNSFEITYTQITRGHPPYIGLLEFKILKYVHIPVRYTCQVAVVFTVFAKY